MTDSQKARRTLKETAASEQWRAALEAEVQALAADPDDRAEMAVVRELMKELASDAKT